jgi:hypothetical protein
MNNMKLIDAGPEGSVVFELLISDKYSNLNGRTGVSCTSNLSTDLVSPRRDAWGSCWGHLRYVDSRVSVYFSIPADQMMTSPDMATTSALCPLATPGYWE